MKALLGIILIITFSFQAYSQYKYPKRVLCEEVKNRTLIVQLIDDVDVEDRQNKKHLNNALKEVFASWSITPIQFMTLAQIDTIPESKISNYVLLLQDDHLLNGTPLKAVDVKGNKVISEEYKKDSLNRYHTYFTFYNYTFDLILPMDERKNKTVLSIGLANGDLAKIEFIYVYQQLERLIKSALENVPASEYYHVDRNIKTLKKYTLVLLKDFFKKDDIPKIQKNYDYDYKVVDFEKYQQLILDKQENVGYCKIIWSNQINAYEWVVVDAKNGGILAQTTFSSIKFGRDHTANDLIKVKHLKHITNGKAQNIYNKYRQ